MKIITTSNSLTDTFITLLNKYKYISFSTAWASSGHIAFDALLKNSKKIKSSTIGLHFYQTDPKVLKVFKGNNNVRFILQTNGVFHPKIYVFYNSDKEWSILMGSANFTSGAFYGKNIEQMILINNSSTSIELYNDCFDFVKELFENKNAVDINDEYISKYKTLFDQRYKNIETLSNIYSSENMGNSILETDILTYSWKEYFKKVREETYHSFNERIHMLDYIQELFSSERPFNRMELFQRQHISGLPNEIFENSGWFGSMRGNGIFWHEINKNNQTISDAIDLIPLKGQIDKHLFMEYFSLFKKIDSLDKNPIGIATRLLSMKRPDLFFCLNAGNKELGKELGIKNLHKIDENRYWNEFLQRIYDTSWFNSPKPKDSKEKSAWKYRVALIDCIYYKANKNG